MASDIKLVVDSSDLSLLNEELNDTNKSVSLVAKNAEKDFKRLMRSIAPLETAQQKYNNQVKVLQKAQLAGVINSKQYANALRDVNAATTDATTGLGALSRQAHQTKNKMNANGMAMQQAGYQVGDFVVQVQSGTNAWVAAGQQLTQLTGVLGMMNPALIGVGAALGIAVPIITAFGAAWSRSKESTDDAAKSLEGLDGRIKNIIGSLEEYDRKKLSLSLNITSEELDVGKAIKQAEADLAAAEAVRIRMTGTAEKTTTGSKRVDFALDVSESVLSYLRGLRTVEDSDKKIAELRETLSKLIIKQEEEAAAKVAELREEAYQDTKKKQAELMFDEIATIDKIIKARKKRLGEEAEDRRREETKIYEAIGKLQYSNSASLEKAHISQLKASGDLRNARDRELQLVARVAAEQMKLVGGTADQQIEAAKLAKETLQVKFDMEDAALRAKDFSKFIAQASKDFKATDFSGLGLIEPYQESKDYETQKRVGEILGKGGKGKKPTTMEGPIKALERQIELSKALFGLEDHARRKEEVYMQLKFQNQDADIKASEKELRSLAERVALEEQRTKVLEEQNKVIEEQRQAQEALADSIAGSMGDAFMSIVDGTKSVKDAFKDMARAIIAELYQIYVVKRITGMISGAIMGSAAAGGYFGPAGGVGGGSGATIPFADGGVIGGPTNFGMSGGRTGLMGEAGPEAIMPLKRGANGKLGVQSEGGSGDVVIHQNFNFAANGDESVKKLIAQAAPQIANMTKSSIISDRRRGGQMKATFG